MVDGADVLWKNVNKEPIFNSKNELSLTLSKNKQNYFTTQISVRVKLQTNMLLLYSAQPTQV